MKHRLYQLAIVFITIDKVYIHPTIKSQLNTLGINKVKPSALLAKLFDVTLLGNRTAIIKNI